MHLVMHASFDLKQFTILTIISEGHSWLSTSLIGPVFKTKIKGKPIKLVHPCFQNPDIYIYIFVSLMGQIKFKKMKFYVGFVLNQ